MIESGFPIPTGRPRADCCGFHGFWPPDSAGKWPTHSAVESRGHFTVDWRGRFRGMRNYGQLRRNTDRRIAHRLAQVALAVVFILTIKLIAWADRWN